MKKSYQEKERDKNLKKIMIFLKRKRKITKLDISKKLGLSIPTVTKFLNELLETGVIFEAELSESSGGRRPLFFEFIPDSILSVAVKLELNYLQLALINLDGKVIKKKTIKKNFINNKNIIEILSQEIKLFVFEIGILKEKIKGIGVSIPGIISDNELILEVGTNFKLYNINFEELQEKLGYSVIIENEANAAALAEFEKQKIKKHKSILAISVNTGIGAGIIIDGKPYKGNHKRAGEAGHITLYPDGKQCNCGNKGCWELYCSNTALIKDFSQEFDNIDSLKDIFTKNILTNENGRKLLLEFSKNMAIGIRDLLLIFDCDKIVISGEICNYSRYIKSDIEKHIFEKDIFYKNQKKKLEFSEYKAEANLIGAGLLTFKEYFIL